MALPRVDRFCEGKGPVPSSKDMNRFHWLKGSQSHHYHDNITILFVLVCVYDFSKTITCSFPVGVGGFTSRSTQIGPSSLALARPQSKGMDGFFCATMERR